jgi:hypothetical protein
MSALPVSVAVGDYRQTVAMSSTPSPVAEAPPLLSPARQGLADAIAALRAARDHFDRERGPAEALEQVIAAADRAEAELTRLQAERMRLVGARLLDGQRGERPSAGKDESRAEHVARRARADAEAAQTVLSAASERRQAAQQVLAAASLRHRDVICAAAAEAALALAPSLAEALCAGLRIQEAMETVARALQAESQAGRLPMSPAGNAAELIHDAIRAVKRNAAVPRDDAAGARFINRLALDAEAEPLTGD